MLSVLLLGTWVGCATDDPSSGVVGASGAESGDSVGGSAPGGNASGVSAMAGGAPNAGGSDSTEAGSGSGETNLGSEGGASPHSRGGSSGTHPGRDGGSGGTDPTGNGGGGTSPTHDGGTNPGGDGGDAASPAGEGGAEPCVPGASGPGSCGNPPVDDVAALRATAAALDAYFDAEANDPEALRAANDALVAELTDEDAQQLLVTLLVILDLRDGLAGDDEPVPDLDAFLLRHQAVPFVDRFPVAVIARSLRRAARTGEAVLGTSFVPQCEPPSCFDQALLFASKKVAANALIDILLQGLTGSGGDAAALRGMFKQCVLGGNCDVQTLLQVAAVVGATSAFPPLKLVMTIVGIAKILATAHSDYTAANEQCKVHQSEPGCRCEEGETVCPGSVECVSIATKERCGDCTTSCPGDQVCVDGSPPRCDCADGKTLCDDQCVNLQFDDANCGACQRGCAPGQTCLSGECKCLAEDDCKFGHAQDPISCTCWCPEGTVECGGACVASACPEGEVFDAASCSCTTPACVGVTCPPIQQCTFTLGGNSITNYATGSYLTKYKGSCVNGTCQYAQDSYELCTTGPGIPNCNAAGDACANYCDGTVCDHPPQPYCRRNVYWCLGDACEVTAATTGVCSYFGGADNCRYSETITVCPTGRCNATGERCE